MFSGVTALRRKLKRRSIRTELMTTTLRFQRVDSKGSKWHGFVETLKVVANPIVISLQNLVVTWVTIETVAKEIDYQSMTLQIEFEQKRLHVGIHHLPVGVAAIVPVQGAALCMSVRVQRNTA